MFPDGSVNADFARGCAANVDGPVTYKFCHGSIDVSFDIVLLQPNPDIELLQSLEEVGAAFPLGTPQEIRRQCDLAIQCLYPFYCCSPSPTP